LCHIAKDKYVLEVGVGAGLTPRYIAKKYGCRVVSVDLSAKMIDGSRRRAQREGLEDKLEFRVADAQNLPFDDATFDVVICESVLAFVPNKPRALSEYGRVTRPGGYVGLNEGTWMRTPPPSDLVVFIERVMAGAQFQTPEAWKELLDNSGLTDTVVHAYKVRALDQWINEMRGFGSADLLDLWRAWRDFFSLLFRSPAFRKYAREITPSFRIITSLFAYLGYGIYVGRK
jgi:ubiquinone/menaquinone biosynthesis C-methylase UbiE